MRTSGLVPTFLISILGLSALWPSQSLARGLGPDPSLLMHLDFDEDFITAGKVLDVTGNGHDGLQFDPTNNITTANGVFGTTAGQWTYKFYQTDGIHIYHASQYLAVTNLGGIQYLTNATISFWAQFDVNGDYGIQVLSAGYPPIYASGGLAQSTNGWFIGRDSTPNLYFCVYGASGVSQITGFPNDVAQSGAALSTAQMHLYTVTIDCVSNIVYSYYDGAHYGGTSTIDVPWIRIYGTDNLPWLAIGTATQGGTPQWGDDLYPNSGYFVGRMDDIRIYNRTLSAGEVQALYQGSTYAQNLAIHKADPQSVQVRWAANSNAVYQVEYLTNLATTAWAPLQSAIPGSVTNSIIDSILGQPTRFYRVRVLP